MFLGEVTIQSVLFQAEKGDFFKSENLICRLHLVPP